MYSDAHPRCSMRNETNEESPHAGSEPEGSIYNLIRSVRSIYDELDIRLSAFARRYGLGCPEGCGHCCVGFTPDITDTEARYLAYHLLTTATDLIGRLETLGLQGTCVFYDQDNPLHCSVYPARPLVCRVFGFAGSFGKNGETVYRGCALIPGAGGVFIDWADPSAAPPVMSDYGIRISTAGKASRTELRTAVLSALGSVGLAIRLSSGLDGSAPEPERDNPGAA